MICMLTCFHIAFLIEKLFPGGPPPDPGKPLAEPLYLTNITAVRIDNASVLVSWNTIQRIKNGKFCKLYEETTTRKEAFTWTLQILQWPYFNNLTSNPSYEEITSQKYFSSYQDSYNMTLNKVQCNRQSYTFTNLMPTFYYKFQIMVEKYRREERGEEGDYEYVVKNIAKNGSHIHYFDKLGKYLNTWSCFSISIFNLHSTAQDHIP